VDGLRHDYARTRWMVARGGAIEDGEGRGDLAVKEVHKKKTPCRDIRDGFCAVRVSVTASSSSIETRHNPSLVRSGGSWSVVPILIRLPPQLFLPQHYSGTLVQLWL